jgi:membrane protein DedA with SNARE-associated domain
VISGITLYFGINTFNEIPPDSITLGQLLFLIFVINGPLICILAYTLYKQKKKAPAPAEP